MYWTWNHVYSETEDLSKLFLTLLDFTIYNNYFHIIYTGKMCDVWQKYFNFIINLNRYDKWKLFV